VCCAVLTSAILVGCSAPTSQTSDEHVAQPGQTSAVRTVTTVLSDGAGGWTSSSRRVSSADPATVRSDDVDTVRAAVQSVGCSHGSQIVLFDGPAYTGNIICFGDPETPDAAPGNTPWNIVDIGAVAPNFQVKSFYTTVPVYLFDRYGDKVDYWCRHEYYANPDVVSGCLPVLKIQTPENRTGSCAFSDRPPDYKCVTPF
jgi:hypothetical protein